MTGQNDRQDRSLTGQIHDQAGHCPLTGRYLQPWDHKSLAKVLLQQHLKATSDNASLCFQTKKKDDKALVTVIWQSLFLITTTKRIC